MSDLSDLRHLLALYAQRVDDQNIDGIVSLFTPDGQVQNPDGFHKGQAGLRSWLEDYFATQPAGRMEQHQVVNAILTVNDDGETAVGRTDFLCFRSLETTPWELEVVTRHHDRFARVRGQWLFSEKAIELRGGFKRSGVQVPDPISID